MLTVLPLPGGIPTRGKDVCSDVLIKPKPHLLPTHLLGRREDSRAPARMEVEGSGGRSGCRADDE